MLRSGKKISIDNLKLLSNEGTILAPIIVINGLVLRADREIPEPIQQFLNNQGAEVERTQYESEWFISLKGRYCLTPESIKYFIEQNQSLIENEMKDLDKVAPGVNLQNEIKEAVREGMSENSLLTFTYGHHKLSIHPSRILGEDRVILKSGANVHNSGRMLTPGSLLSDSHGFIHKSEKKCLGCGQVGFFADIRAGEKADVASNKMTIKNARTGNT